MPRDVMLRPSFDLEDDLAGAAAVCLGVGPDGVVAALGVEEDAVPLVRDFDEAGGARVPRSRTRSPYDAAVAIRDVDGGLRRIALPGLELAHPRIQPLAGGGVLVVGARARRGEANAEVRDRDGTLVGAFPLGDGIVDVQAAADGALWVAYLDDGDAALPDAAPTPGGAAPLARFGPDGTPRDRLDPPEQAADVVETAALNAGPGDVWAICQPGGALVRVGADGTAAYASPLQPVRAIAVDEERRRGLILLGDVVDGHAVALVTVDDGWIDLLAEVRPVDESGAPLAVRAATARGRVLHLLAGSRVYPLDVRDARR